MLKIGLNGKQGGGKSYISRYIAKHNQNMIAFDGSNLSLQLMNLYLRTYSIDEIRNASITYSITNENVLLTTVNNDVTLQPPTTKDGLMLKMQAYSLRENEMDVWDAIFAKTRDFISAFSEEKADQYDALIVTGRKFDVLMPDADMRFYITADAEKRQVRASTRDAAEEEMIKERERIEEEIFLMGEDEILFDTTPYNTTEEVDKAIEQQILPIINDKIGPRPISILLVGVSNAGKSTLLSDLGEKYPYMIQVPEVAATYMREHQIHVNPEQMTPEVFNMIARSQIEAVNQASRGEQKIMCIDGNPLILYLSGKILFSHDNPELLELAIQFMKRADIVIWCDEKNIKFEATHDNGMERGPEWLNGAMKEEYLRILADNGIKYEYVSGTREERVQQVEKILGRHMSKIQIERSSGEITFDEISNALMKNKQKGQGHEE